MPDSPEHRPGEIDFGDVIGSDSDDDDKRMDIEDSCEAEHKYDGEGGFYPVQIGDILGGRYRIEHKLGSGGYSTVWMGCDIETGKCFALKISNAEGKGRYEYHMNTEIARLTQDTSKLLLCHGWFCLRGLYGEHVVLIFPLRGPSVGSNFEEMPIRWRMSAAKQFLQALASLHHSGFVHGDINNRNLMWDMTALDDYDLATKYKCLGRPQRHPLASRLTLSKAGELVSPMQVPQDMLRELVFLGDFGLAMRTGTSVDDKMQGPFRYCAPERFHNIDPSPASDMWGYMCIFTELYLGISPFQGYAYGSPSTIDRMVARLGQIPKQWKEHHHDATYRNDPWYGECRTPAPGFSLAEMVHKRRPDASLSEQSDVVDVMTKVFRYHPQHRLTAAALLQDEVFKRVMEYYQL